MKNLLYLHIGIHRTWTTLLQKHIFPKSNKILYLGRYYDENKLNYEYFKIFNNLSVVKLNFFQIRKLKKIQQDILASNENILRPFSFDDNILVNNLDILNDIFNLKILITIRDFDPKNTYGKSISINIPSNSIEFSEYIRNLTN